MEYLGISFNLKHSPRLEPGFIPYGVWMDRYLKGAKQPVAVAIQREQEQISVYRSYIYGTPEMHPADLCHMSHLVKFLLWTWGGFRIMICGCDEIAKEISGLYTSRGERAFEYSFFYQLYQRDLEVISLPLSGCPEAKENPRPAGGHLDGCRIGFDAGGSDRKVSAVIDGKCVYSEEVVWNPKTQPDPQYHFDGIVDALRTAASKMPRVDAIGISSAGVFIGNKPMVASLFGQVPRENWDKVHTIYDRAGAVIGDIPVVVANDGDVTALAGAMGMNCSRIMGIAMGTGEAVGYVDENRNLPGWISELHFAPVDLNPNMVWDQRTHDRGTGGQYFCQDTVIRLAEKAGISLDPTLTPPEKLKQVQKYMEADDPRAQAIFRDMGCCLAYTVVLYARFYDIRNLMILGRVTSGKGGDTMLSTCRAVLADEFPQLNQQLQVFMPDENTRRVGQAVAAASLPELEK